jgi:hypothetical protein
LFNFFYQNGRADEGAAYTNALLIDSLYHDDLTMAQRFAVMTGIPLVRWKSNVNLPIPGYALFVGNNTALLVVAGTTTAAEWLGHAGSFLSPAIDRNVPLRGLGLSAVSMGYWQSVADVLYPIVNGEIATMFNGLLQITGHSYGAAVAHILARRFANARPSPGIIHLMTFGEPRAYDGRAAVREPDYHARIIATAVPFSADDRLGVDPVTRVPPGLWTLARIGPLISAAKYYFDLAWGHFGFPWLMHYESFEEGIDRLAIANLVPGIEYALLVESLPFAPLHLMDQSYLIAANRYWRRSGLYVTSPSLQGEEHKNNGNQGVNLNQFNATYTAYTGAPYVPFGLMGPPAPPLQLNGDWGLAPNTSVTTQNYYQWSVLSATATFFSINNPLLYATGSMGIGDTPIIHGSTSGAGRPFWLYRGFDRNLIRQGLSLLSFIANRDANLSEGQLPIFDPEDEAQQNALALLIQWFEFLLGLQRG